MNFIKEFRWTLISIPLTVFGIIICVFLMGGGHGTYTPTIYLFPYAMLTALLEKTIGPTSIILGLIQFTVYGLIFDLTKTTKRALLFKVTLLLLHGLTIAFVLLNRGETF